MVVYIQHSHLSNQPRRLFYKGQNRDGSTQSGQSLGDVDLRSDLNSGAVCGNDKIRSRTLQPLSLDWGLLFWIHQNSPTSLGTRGKGWFIYNTHTFQTNRGAFSTKDKTVTGQPQSGQSLGDVDLRSDLNSGAVCGDDKIRSRTL